ncbi:Tn3 family transposase [Aminobacter ciceronei]|uniref:Tn3 transposase DDE domain-containing protein n=1 Tax=Aminobacter ciceronei TaxID=150723 RepID=A0ABR6CA66_9HYPH|nr:Tn3 family transposase [Aminobacter ciceronei]MBA8908021.1 hypothetical protein [Aminobacter ciceronei]MBA9021776.1 hypothetical protein [Aminobacter ciceronei]
MAEAFRNYVVEADPVRANGINAAKMTLKLALEVGSCGQLGELRNRFAETMAYGASGLNLVVNANILWNTVYLSCAVGYVRGQGIVIPEELLSQVAPLPWVHIALTGDYLWSELDRPLERCRRDPR